MNHPENVFERIFGHAGAAAADPKVEAALLTLLLAFVLGQLIAWVYVGTHSGLSYSRAFCQSIVLITMVVALVLNVIGDSIVTAFGLLGALAIIRFRNVLKDTKDTSFVFFALVVGMAVGSQRYLTAIIGTIALLAAAFWLHWTSFGTRGRYDAHLTCSMRPEASRESLAAVLARFCRRTDPITTREGAGDEVRESLYQIRLRDRRRTGEFLAALRALPGVVDANLVLRDELAEV